MSEIFFFKNHAENKADRLFPDFFLFFKKVFVSPRFGHTVKTYEASHC